jgi:hypothetical protein
MQLTDWLLVEVALLLIGLTKSLVLTVWDRLVDYQLSILATLLYYCILYLSQIHKVCTV